LISGERTFCAQPGNSATRIRRRFTGAKICGRSAWEARGIVAGASATAGASRWGKNRLNLLATAANSKDARKSEGRERTVPKYCRNRRSPLGRR
jgi:hypothetical protein